MTHGTRWLSLLAVTALLLAAFGGVPRVARAASTYYVTTTVDLRTPNDNCLSPCSLAQAILAADEKGGPGSVIEFDIPNTDPGYDGSDLDAQTWTITPDEPLPFIDTSDNITIDGASQARNLGGGNPNSFGPEIIINGANITTAGGIVLVSDNNKIQGLGIVNFQGQSPTGTGIEIRQESSGNFIWGNYIGLNKYGNAPFPNKGPGIWVRGSGNFIGGESSESTGRFNVISGNADDGVLVEGNNNEIRGNYIGTNRNGLTAVPNGGYGVNVRINANGNIIGADAGSPNAVFRNVISGNKRFGIVIRDSKDNKIFGNFIGVNSTGDARIPNEQGGIHLLSTGTTTSGNLVGAPGNRYARNYIAGNIGPGVLITGKSTPLTTARNNTIANNFIGLGISGFVPNAVRSQTVGVLIEEGAQDNTIGGEGAGNVISGIGGDGVRIVGRLTPTIDAQSDGNIVAGNNIGTNVAGNGRLDQALPGNNGSGVVIGTNAYYSEIGGDNDAKKNNIAYNGINGVHLSHPNIENTFVQRNFIARNTVDGVRVDGSRSTDVRANTIWYNGANGVNSFSASYLTVTGDSNDVRSSITGNVFDAIHATDNLSLTVQYVDTAPVDTPNGGDGVDSANDQFTSILSSNLSKNTGLGIRLAGTYVARINGTDVGNKSQITKNGLGGAFLTDVYSATLTYNDLNTNGTAQTPGDGLTILRGNIITALVNNTEGNFGAGVNVTSTLFLRFESDSDGNANRVIGNRRGGIRLTGVTSGTLRFNTVNNNYDDGIRVSGDTQDVLITRNRVQLNGPQNAQGGVCPAFTNPALERSMPGQGVSVRDTSRFVKIIRNSFTRNCGLAILREPNTIAGSNQGIQPPSSLTLTKLTPTTALVTGKVELGGAGGCPGCTVELYESDPKEKPDAEGIVKLNGPTDFITAFDEKGTFSFNLARIPKQLLATATDKFGNTSEFAVFTATYGIDISPNRAQHAYPTQVITYFHTVTNLGSVGDTFALTVDVPAAWSATPQPLGPFALPAGKSIPVTVTLKLPVGTAPTALANTDQKSFVRVTAVYSSAITDYVTDTTTVDPKVVISVSPGSSIGEVQATKTITYAHQITNNGNITATVNLGVNTTPAWNTVVSTNTLTLIPGASRTVTVSVTPPNGTQQGAKAQTVINVNVPLDPSQNKVLTDTTTVVVTPRVTITPPVVNGDGAADKTTKYTDFIVLNNSNGTTRFRLVGLSTFGSTVTFSSVGGVPLESGNRFTLGVTPNGNPSNQLQLQVDVKLPRVIPTGAIDVTTIQVLDDTTGAVLAVAQARTTVRQGRTIIYLPIVRK